MSPKTDEEVRALVREAVASLAPARPAAVEGGQRIVEDLGYNSLTVLELVFALEEELDASLMEDGAAGFITTVDDIERYILGRYREQQHGRSTAPYGQ
jgi:acyl carrier protein